jgi:hypothetical protein
MVNGFAICQTDTMKRSRNLLGEYFISRAKEADCRPGASPDRAVDGGASRRGPGYKAGSARGGAAAEEGYRVR